MRRYALSARARQYLGLAAGAALLLLVVLGLASAYVSAFGQGRAPAAVPSPSPSPSPPSPSPSPAPAKTPIVEPGHTPWPTPDPAIWRFEGTVSDEAGRPLAGVCVHGPSGCHPASPHTDVRGRYFFDVAQKTTIPYDLWFVLEGYETFQQRVTPQGPTVFDVTLRRRLPQ